MRFALAVIGCLGFTLVGCASIDTQKERLAATKSCCLGPHEFHYKDVPPTGELRLSISGESPAFEFPSGRSYFDAVRLSRGEHATKIRIKIHHFSDPRPLFGIFCPSVTFLTSQFRAIQTTYEPPRWREIGFWSMTGGFHFADYHIPPAAVYAVIHSEAGRAGESLTRVMPEVFQGLGPFGLGAVVLNLIQIASSGEAFTRKDVIPCAPIGAGGALMITHDISD